MNRQSAVSQLAASGESLASKTLSKSGLEKTVLKGHGFSRAEKFCKTKRALAPEEQLF
jgi:hypothetical protein